MSSVAEEVVIRCENLVRKEKFCEEDISELSTFINNFTSKNRNLSTQWPTGYWRSARFGLSVSTDRQSGHSSCAGLRLAKRTSRSLHPHQTGDQGAVTIAPGRVVGITPTSLLWSHLPPCRS